jgi:hypothetical protein
VTREALANRLRLAERQAQLALAEVQAANWPTPSDQPALIAQLAWTAGRLERVAKTLDGPRRTALRADEFVAVAVLVAIIAAAVTVVSRPVQPLAIATGCAVWAAIYGPVHWAIDRRTAAKATVVALADTTPFAERVLVVHQQIEAILLDVQPELGPKRRKAQAQLRVALDWITPAADQARKQSLAALNPEERHAPPPTHQRSSSSG